MRRGQIISIEILLTLLLFMTLFFIFQARINQMFFDSQQNMHYRAYLLAFQTSQLLSSSPGSPNAWNSSNVKYVGLAKYRNVLDYEKTKRFFNEMDYNESNREKLSAGFYNVYVVLKNASDNSIITINGSPAEFGIVAPNNNIFAVSVRTPVIYAESRSYLDVILWDET